MCFSVGVSFTSAVILVPVGLLCLKKTSRVNKSFWAFAILPVGFGIQQAFEGGVWRALDVNDDELLRLSALGFLFFSHFFWLIWTPIASYLVETEKSRKTLFLLIAIMGAIIGSIMFLSFLIYPDTLNVSTVNHSILYKTTLVYNDYLPRYINSTVYALMILLPLISSSDKHLRMLGVIILFSMFVSMAFFKITFVSVWCYFSACISLYIYYILTKKEKAAEYSQVK